MSELTAGGSSSEMRFNGTHVNHVSYVAQLGRRWLLLLSLLLLSILLLLLLLLAHAHGLPFRWRAPDLLRFRCARRLARRHGVPPRIPPRSDTCSSRGPMRRWGWMGVEIPLPS